jgi:hypothetical protein
MPYLRRSPPVSALSARILPTTSPLTRDAVYILAGQRWPFGHEHLVRLAPEEKVLCLSRLSIGVLDGVVGEEW